MQIKMISFFVLQHQANSPRSKDLILNQKGLLMHTRIPWSILTRFQMLTYFNCEIRGDLKNGRVNGLITIRTGLKNYSHLSALKSRMMDYSSFLLKTMYSITIQHQYANMKVKFKLLQKKRSNLMNTVCFTLKWLVIISNAI